MAPPKDVTLLDGPGAERTRGVGILEVLKATEKVALPLAKVDITASVADRVAEVTVTQTFRNPHTEALEAVYIFPLAGGCAVSDFVMKVGKRTIKGICKERGEARATYQRALNEGKRAALLEMERDDVFTVQVGNLPPGEEVTVIITYSERLPFFENGSTELRLPLVVAPRYIAGQPLDRPPVGDGTGMDTNKVPDGSRITPPRLADGFDPQTALNINVTLDDELDDLACSQHATRTSMGGDGVKISLARKDELMNRDFVLRWRIGGASTKPTLMISNGHAMLSLLPPKRDGFLGLSRDVVFVVDRSGSMAGVKMASASRACSILLHTLGPRDRFAIQAFDDSPEWFEPNGADGYFLGASEAGIVEGDKYLRTINDRGGTEMDRALQAAIEAIADRKDSTSRSAIIVFITDGEVGDESSVLKRVQTELGDARVFTVGVDTAVNDGFIKKLAALGGGTSTLVVPGDALDEALRAVGREIGDPLVTDITIDDADALAPARMPDLFAGRAATAFFMTKAKKIRVRGTLADGKKYDVTVTAKEIKLPAIAHLWARTRVADLEDQFRLKGGSDAIKKQIVELAVAHTLLTRFTAFVVVDESEIVNASGEQRKIVQPVHEPDRWEMEKKEIAESATMQFGQAAKSKLDDVFGSGGGSAGETDDLYIGADLESEAPPGAGAPPPPPAPKPSPAQPPMKQKKIGILGRLFGGKGASSAPEEQKPPPVSVSRPTPPDTVDIQKALDALVKAFAKAHAEVKAGRVPKADDLDKARTELMKALAASVVGQQLGKLQRFVRSALMEILAAMKAGASAASLAPLFDKHAPLLDEAKRELHTPFWEGSV